MTESALIVEKDQRGIVTITLNRPERHNAFDDAMIAELQQTLDSINDDAAVRLLVLRANGKSFSAGADLNWMRRMADYDYQQNVDDALLLARMLNTLNSFSKPTVGLVQGASFGGGVGLVACCDIVIASEAAKFSLSEVLIGLIPATISPYVIAAIGERAARRYFLSAERFDATEAHRIGLVHEVVSADELDSILDSMIDQLLLCGPAAQSASKQLIQAVTQQEINEELIKDTAQRIATIRASDEGREGLNAFLNKRKPDWNKS